MLDFLRRVFGEGKTPPTEHDVRLATCALFVELATIDGEFTDKEVDIILSFLREQYGIANDQAEALLAEARQEAAESIDIWKFTNQINEHYSTEDKLKIVELLWRIVFADDRMDDHEHYLMGRLVNLLRLEHGQVFKLKAAVRDGS